MRSLCAQLIPVTVPSRSVDMCLQNNVAVDGNSGVDIQQQQREQQQGSFRKEKRLCLQNKVAVVGNSGVDIQQQQHQQQQRSCRNEKSLYLQNNVAVDGNRGLDIQQQQHEQQQGSFGKEKRLCLQNKVAVDGNSGVDIQQQQGLGRTGKSLCLHNNVTIGSTRGGDVITGTNSNEHPRLESVSDSRSSINIAKTNSLRNHNLICSSFVKPVSIVNVCDSSKNTINVITPNDAHILRLPMINNINNTNCDNLTTIDSVCDYKTIRNSHINTNIPKSSRKVNESNMSGFSENTEDNVVTSSKDVASTPSLTRRCSLLLPKRVSFSQSVEQQHAQIHVITVPPKI